MIRRGAVRIEDATRPTSDPLDLFASGDPPAFATDSWHRITFWNRGAERVLGHSAAEVLGRPCFDVMKGRDIFGNRYCYEKCPVFATVRKGESPAAFDLVVSNGAPDPRTLSITTLQVQGSRPDVFTIVHILRPVDEARRLAQALENLGVARATVGGQPVTPEVAGSASPAPPLTPRETEILRCVAGGLQNKEIALRLDISLATVRNHIHNILEKLDVHSKLEAVSLAFRNGWVSGNGNGA